MTPKEKARELVDKFNNHTVKELVYLKNGKVIEGKTEAKQCALIAVDEILELKETQEEYQIQYDNGEWSRDVGYRYSKYWQKVKQEIKNF